MRPSQFISEVSSNFSEIVASGFVINDELVVPRLNPEIDPDDLEGLIMRLYFLATDPDKEIKFFINQYEENRFLYLTKVSDSVWFFALCQDNNFAKLHFFVKYLLTDVEINLKAEKEKNTVVSDGLSSAKRIQGLLLPDMKETLSIFKKSYFWYQPKDEIGGDFYWATRTKAYQWLVIGDCTGHAVEGALASVSVLSILQQVFKPDLEPHLFIKLIHEGLRNIQQQDLLQGYGIGCEMMVIRLDLKDQTMKYSGTGLPLCHISDKVRIFKTKKSSLDPDRVVKYVRSRSLKLEKGEGIFTYSDGLIDQIRENGKRIKTAALLRNIQENGINTASMEKYFTSWRGAEPQTDDVVCLYLAV